MRRLTLAIALLAGPPAVFAQATPDAFDLCAREQDAATRLACFDKQVAARHAAAATRAATPHDAPASVAPTPKPKGVPATAAPTAAVAGTTAPVSKAVDEVGLDSQQLRKLHPEDAKYQSPAVTIQAKVVRVIERRPLISAFELDNGQVWEQREAVARLWIRPADSVTIRLDSMGSFFLKSADGAVVRVSRIK